MIFVFTNTLDMDGMEIQEVEQDGKLIGTIARQGTGYAFFSIGCGIPRYESSSFLYTQSAIVEARSTQITEKVTIDFSPNMADFLPQKKGLLSKFMGR